MLKIDEIISAEGQIKVTNSLEGSTITNCDFINLVGNETTIMTLVNSNVTVQSELITTNANIASRRLQEDDLIPVTTTFGFK
jgi:hypothetical protein